MSWVLKYGLDFLSGHRGKHLQDEADWLSQHSEMEKWKLCLENFTNPVCWGSRSPRWQQMSWNGLEAARSRAFHTVTCTCDGGEALLNAVSVPLSGVQPPGTPRLLILDHNVHLGLVVWTLLGKPRTAQRDSKQGNKGLERCLVVVWDTPEGVWALVPLAPNVYLSKLWVQAGALKPPS